MGAAKTSYLDSGSEEGYSWSLRLGVCENTKRFHGSFVLIGGEARRDKNRTRALDRYFFRQRLGDVMKKYKIHHDWDNGGVTYLLTPQEHHDIHARTDKKDWIEKEEWLE